MFLITASNSNFYYFLHLYLEKSQIIFSCMYKVYNNTLTSLFALKIILQLVIHNFHLVQHNPPFSSTKVRTKIRDKWKLYFIEQILIFVLNSQFSTGQQICILCFNNSVITTKTLFKIWKKSTSNIWICIANNWCEQWNWVAQVIKSEISFAVSNNRQAFTLID